MKLIILTLVACLSLFAARSHAATAVVSDDAFTTTASVKLKRGTLPTISVSARETGFVRFDLSALPPNLPAEQIAKATLRLWVSRVIRGGSANVFPIEAEWNELTVTQATAPAIGATTEGIIALPAGRKAFYASLDVTDLVREWVTGQRANHGIALKADGTSAATIDAKENMATSHEPTLEIVLAGPEGKQGVSGTGGTNGTDGTNGTNGLNGADGKDGKDGAPGVQGIPGIQGPPGPATQLPAGNALLVGSGESAPAGYSETGVRIAGWTTKVTVNGYFNGVGATLALIGGRVFGAGSGRVQEFDAVQKEWLGTTTEVGPLYSVAANDGTTIYFCGGRGAQGQALDTVVTFNPITGAIGSLPVMPVPIWGSGSSTWSNGRLYVTNGSLLYEFNPASQQWVTYPGPASGIGTLTSCGDTLFGVFNGSISQIKPGLTGWQTTKLPDGFLFPAAINANELLIFDPPKGNVIRFNSTDRTYVFEAVMPLLNGGGIGGVIGSDVVFFVNTQHVSAPVASFRRLLIKQ